MSTAEPTATHFKSPTATNTSGTTHKSVWEKCPFLKLITKIWDAVCWFFNKIGEVFNPSPYDLSKKDLEYLRAAKSRYRPKSPPDTPRQSLRKRHVSVKSGGVASGEDSQEEKSAAAKSALNDEVYKDFKRAGLDFVDHAIEATYEEMVEPQLPTVQKHLGKLKEYLNFGADFVISIGQGIITPLEEKLEAFNIAENLKPDMKKLMNWLLKDQKSIDQDLFIADLKKRVGDIFKQEDQRDQAVEHCRKWLFDTDQSEALIDPSAETSRKRDVKEVFRHAATILAEKRISQFDAMVKENLNGNLPDIIQRMMKYNGQKIGEIVINRLIEILDKAPFTETFDDVIALLADQSSAVVDAERARKREIAREEAQMDRNERAFRDSPQADPQREANRQLLIENREAYIKSSRELWVSLQGDRAYKQAIKDAKLHIQELESGDETSDDLTQIREQGEARWIKSQAYKAKATAVENAKARIISTYAGEDQDAKDQLDKEIKDQWLESIGEGAARLSYREFLVDGKPLCHEKIQELELVQDAAETDAKKSSGGIENVLEVLMAMLPREDESDPHLFDASAQRLMDLLFPPVQVEDESGEVYTVDGLLYLFDQIEYEDELKKIYDEAVFIYQKVLTIDKQEKVIDLIQANYEAIERCVLKLARTKTQSTVSQAIASLFQKFIVPQKVNEMMAYDALPALQDTITEGLAKSILSNQLKIYAPLFRELVDAKNDDKSEKRTVIVDRLSATVRENLRGYSEYISEEKLKELIENPIRLIETVLTECIDEVKLDDGEDRDDAFLRLLKGFFKTQYHDTNPRYGDLIINTAFKMGKLSGTAEYFSNWFKGTLSREVSAATHEVRESPHYLLQKATEQIDHRYSTKEAVKEVLYKKGPELENEATDARLKQEQEKTARIAHDLLYYNASQQGLIARNAIKWVIGSNHEILDGVIKRVYHQMLGNTLYTQNLMVRFQEKISEALRRGAEAVAKAQTTIPKVKKVPSLVPSFVYEKGRVTV